ncbi:S53 family peptidase [Actinospica robiniae]|uniref:S53 family peptidase n=1 Tax=Actinospica robiniae TaxID=304901 RepID=UPI00041B447D|nr:S53 family peptidase [Actinospica robiniae]
MSSAVQRRHRRIASTTAISVVLAALTTGFAAAGPASADQAAATTLAGSSPSYATASADQGQTSSATQLSFRVYLAGQNASGLAAYAQAVSDPTSSLYRHFLSASQAEARYGATSSQISAVTAWLKGAGFTVTSTNEHWIDVKGAAADVPKAFSTSMHNYKTSDGTLHAPQQNVRIPSSVASAVSGVSGLAQATTHAVTMSESTGKAPSNNDPSCSDYYGQKKAPSTAPAVPAGYSNPSTLAQCSMVPSELRQAYGVTQSKLTGKGATIAIVNWYGSSTMEADADQYSVNHGDKPFAPGQYSEVSTPSQWTNEDVCGFGDNSEEALDVEMAHGLAPAAKVVTVAANSCFDSDLLAAEAEIVDNHLADIVSNSWGESIYSTAGNLDPSLEAAYNQVFEQGAVEGIAFDFSTGDCMNNDSFSVSTGLNCDPTVVGPSVDWPTSSPWVTAVGGTALGLNKQGGYGFETAMGDERSGRTAPGSASWAVEGTTFGGGGGISQTEPQPWYQTWVVPKKLSTTLPDGSKTSPKRTIPDISLNGDLYFSSTQVGQTTDGVYSEAGYGGTSVSAPSWAGVLADAQQAQGGPIGFANPSIYLRASLATDVTGSPRQIGNSKVDSVIFEYPAGNAFAGAFRLVQYNADEGLPATKGYDLATGVGSPNLAFLESFGWFRF